MAETVILAMLAAKIRGYRLKPLFRSWEVYPVILFVIVYIFLNTGVFLGHYEFVRYAGVLEKIYICTFLFLIFKYNLYASAIFGSISIFMGVILNKIVISANNGKMPVFPTISYLTGYAKPEAFSKVNDIHVLGNAATNLKFLTDILDLGYSILSIGDVFIRVFTFIIIFNAIKSINILQRRESLC